MTRKQAILKAIQALEGDMNNQEVVMLLRDIYEELPLVHWSDKSIRDTVNQFVLDFGRNPTTTDFKRKGMPPHPVIKQKYKITLSQWLDKNYPTVKPSYEEIKRKVTEDFIKDYERIKPTTQKMFIENKTPNTRSWRTVAKYNDATNWCDLLDKLNLEIYRLEKTPSKLQVKIIVPIEFEYYYADDNKG